MVNSPSFLKFTCSVKKKNTFVIRKPMTRAKPICFATKTGMERSDPKRMLKKIMVMV